MRKIRPTFFYRIWRRWYSLNNIGWQFYLANGDMAHMEYRLYRDLKIDPPILYRELYERFQPLRELKKMSGEKFN